MEMTWSADAESLPRVSGAYALLITLEAPAVLPMPRFGGVLDPGHYCYLGSAFGPGGIRARCTRHLRRDKPKKWHVDWLTNVAVDVAVSPHPGATECALTARLSAFHGASIPIAGFGSSDCRRCPAHLVRLNGLGGDVLMEAGAA